MILWEATLFCAASFSFPTKIYTDMGTKNNPKNRAKAIEKKKFNGKEVEPIYYYGVHAGHGKYMAAKYAGSSQLVTNAAHKPMQWDEIN